jgi:cytochrome bd-type quinol oxidase subunit 2
MAEKNPVNSANQNDRLILASSVGTAVYFVIMIGIYHFKIDNQILGFIRELFTIPVVILLIVLFVMSGIGLSREKKKFSSRSFYSFLILILTIVLLIASA